MIQTFFSPLVGLVLRYRYVTIGVALSTLILVMTLIKSGIMGFTLFPVVEADRAVATVTFPYGTPAEVTARALEKLRASALETFEELDEPNLDRGIIEMLGITNRSTRSSGSHTGEIQVLLIPAEDRQLMVSEFTDAWRERTGRIAHVKSLVFQADRGGPGSGPGLSVQVTHPDLKVLEMADERLLGFLGDYDMVSDLQSGFDEGKPQFNLHLSPLAEELGVDTAVIARQVRAYYSGAEAIRQLRGRHELRVRVMADESERQMPQKLKSMRIEIPSRGSFPLEELVTIEEGFSDTEIQRVNGARIITLEANVTPRAQASVIQAELSEKFVPELTRMFPELKVSFEGRQRDMMDSMKVLGLGFMVALLGIYVLLAIPFRSYLQPMVIMVAIPFGIVGAVIGHLVMGYSLSVMSMFGVVALSGVVVNDSLVLIDVSNRFRREGMSAIMAVHQASVRRFRPIILTSVTTFFGLAPMILETSPQARFMIPMAISLGFGILFATVIALLLVPCLVVSLDDIQKDPIGRRFRRSRAKPQNGAGAR